MALLRALKDVEWMGDALKVIRAFPEDVRADLGADLMRLQCGLEPNNWKPFPGLKRPAFELRSRNASGIYRAIYVTLIKDKIYVLHCFQKKSAKAGKKEKDTANERLAQLLREEKVGTYHGK